MKVELNIPDAAWKAGDIVQERPDGGRKVLVMSRHADGRFVVVNGTVEVRVDSDHYTAATQEGSTYPDGTPMMPGALCVFRRQDLDCGCRSSVDGLPAMPITDSDEYRRMRDEWEAKHVR